MEKGRHRAGRSMPEILDRGCSSPAQSVKLAIALANKIARIARGVLHGGS